MSTQAANAVPENSLIGTLLRIPAVFVFEWRRVMTIPRLAGMATLALFPPLLLFLIRLAAHDSPPTQVAAIIVYALSPCVACMMSVFLLASPAIASELEGRSWVYLAVRPHGPIAVLVGKYLVAVSWALPVGLVSAVLGTIAIGSDETAKLILVECFLVCLSCIAYAAVFLLLGVIIPRRAMVAGVIYAVLIEVAAAFIPAAVNLLTIQHRLRCVLVRCIDMDVTSVGRNPVYLAYFGEESTFWHVGILIAMTIGYLIAAALVLHLREFTSASETET
jgi:ABC-type transport system involved in multi-copper enzyme maturation permease subunit